MSAEPVRYEQSGAVVTVTLDRPDSLNSLDTATKDALLAALDKAASDDSVRCLVLTGTGRGFSAGQDLKDHIANLTENPAEVMSTVARHYVPIAALLATMPKPVVAAVNGIAAGAGASMAMACDIRLVARSGGFNLAFANVALSCDTGASWWLPRLVGVAKAKELLLLPRTVRADEALELGLATMVLDDEALAGEAAAVAARLAAGPTLAYASIRQAIAFSMGHDLAESLDNEERLMRLTGSSADHRAAVEAFVGKAAPEFTGR
ncbi:MAG: enoyl-CoA hydratase-related protein [Actinomycetales bacterium]